MKAIDVQGNVPANAGARDPGDVSQRELEVISLVADRRSDGEIATELFISKKTLACMSRTSRKIAVESRVEIATEAIRLGLVKPLTAGQR